MDQEQQGGGGGFCGRTWRQFLWETGGGFASVALAALLGTDGFFAGQVVAADGKTPWQPLAPRPPHFAPKAKSVVFLYMYGGPSHIDTFDYKPGLVGMDNKTIDVKTFGRGGHKNQGRIVEPRWAFKQYGQSGKWVSDLFPHLATCVDEIAFVHSMTADSPIHGSAMLQMNTGKVLSGSPCLGSWLNYGLGSANENLPGFVVMLDPRGGPISGPKNWSSGFGEFGWQPTAEYAKGTGRDHNAYGFTMWRAGGGIKGGVSVGQTDELGSRAVKDPFHVKHLHATILHQMGLDPNRLSFFYAGLNQKLVGVEGAEPIKKII